MDSLEQYLLDQLQEKFGGQPVLSDSLMMMGVDSVGMAELTYEIEKKFDIRVDDEVLNVETVADLASYVRSRLATSA